MAKKECMNKHPDWRLSRSEKNWYYVGDTARLFCTSLVGSYMTVFLMFQGINTASLATAILCYYDTAMPELFLDSENIFPSSKHYTPCLCPIERTDRGGEEKEKTP